MKSDELYDHFLKEESVKKYNEFNKVTKQNGYYTYEF